MTSADVAFLEGHIRCSARRGRAGHGAARRGTARRGEARQRLKTADAALATEPHPVRQRHAAGYGEARLGGARSGKARANKATNQRRTK